VEKFLGDRISFKDGKEAEFESVVLATGYRPKICISKE
jgi:NAD(P)H-nitrite reductase large subunit